MKTLIQRIIICSINTFLNNMKTEYDRINVSLLIKIFDYSIYVNLDRKNFP